MQGPLTRIEGGGGTAEAVERLLQVEIALVLTFVVGLPELQERVPDQMAVTVINVAEHQDMFTRRIGPGHAVPDLLVTGRVAGGLQGQTNVHIRAGSLRRGFRQQFDRHGKPPQRFSKWVLRWPRRTMSKR
ncbi:hypothetical protein D3C84_1045350 [compost metagenome]